MCNYASLAFTLGEMREVTQEGTEYTAMQILPSPCMKWGNPEGLEPKREKHDLARCWVEN